MKQDTILEPEFPGGVGDTLVVEDARDVQNPSSFICQLEVAPDDGDCVTPSKGRIRLVTSLGGAAEEPPNRLGRLATDAGRPLTVRDDFHRL